MGLDYSYELRFRRNQLKEILLALVELSKPNPDPPLEVILPGGTDRIFMPFYSLPSKQNPVTFEGRYPPAFCIVPWFEPDEPLERYAATQAAEGHPFPRDERSRIAFGCVWLSLSSLVSKPSADNPDLEFLDFDFTPAWRGMSMVFAASESIRRFFVELLEDHNGIRGLFVDSDYGWGPITIWPETAPDYTSENLLELHYRLSPDKPYYRFPLNF